MLTGPEIARQVEAGRITIDPYDPAQLGPNSYDLRLHPHLVWYDVDPCGGVLDAAEENPTFTTAIPPEGFVLWPGRLYLATTVERAGSDHYVPCIEGRSSVARLGVSVHVTAGFGDHGFDGQWTLEMTAVHPVRVYAGLRVCQVFFDELTGERRPYRGRYAGQAGPQASRLFLDFRDGGSRERPR